MALINVKETAKSSSAMGHVTNVGTVEERAQHFADILNGAEAFNNDLADLSDANENTKRGPFVLLWDMRAIMGEEIHNLPVPGSEKGKVNNYDYYPKDNSKEMKGPNKGSFYNDVFDLLKVGAKLKAEAAAIKDDDTLPDMTKAERSARIKARQTYGRNALTKCARLQFQIDAIAELAADGVNLAELTDMVDGVAVPRPGPKPFRLDNVNAREKFRLLSVDQVLNLDPAKASEKFKANGGKISMWECLLGTLKAEPKTGGEAGPGQTAPAIKNTTAFGDYLSEVVAFANTIDADAKLGNQWEKEVLKDGAADLRDNLISLEQFLNGITETPAFKAAIKADRLNRNNKGGEADAA